MSIKVFVNTMVESHRTTFWVTFKNEKGETTTPHYFEEREKAVFTAAEYAKFFGDIESFDSLMVELEKIDPVMHKFLIVTGK